MNIEEIKERRASNLRTGSDIFMGFFYALVGVLLVYGRALSTIRLPDAIMGIPAWVVYILGSMLAVGGSFRFYRGIRQFLPQKKSNDITSGQ